MLNLGAFTMCCRIVCCYDTQHSISLLFGELARFNHILGFENVVQLLAAHKISFEHQVVDTLAGLESLLSERSGVLVADVGVQGGYQTNRVVDQAFANLLVGGDATHFSLRVFIALMSISTFSNIE